MKDEAQKSKKKAASKTIREGLLAFFVVFGASTLCIVSIYLKASSAQVEAVRSELGRLARQAAALVDPELHQQLHDPEQMDTELYDTALRPLANFHRSIPEVFYVYSMIKRGDELIFVLDTSTRPEWLQFDREMEPSAIMDVYEDPGPTTLQAYDQAIPMTDEEPYTDEFGTFISGYAPVFDEQGNHIALVGVDLELADFHSRMDPVRLAAGTAMITALFIACVTGVGLVHSRRASAEKAAQLSSAMDDLFTAKNAAEKATNTKSQFLATMSHEIRTPLNGLVGVLHLFEEDLPEAKRHLLKTALNCSDDLQVLINDVLDFSKIEAGKMTVKPVPIDTCSLSAGLCSLHSPIAAAKSIEFRFEPSEERELYCLADPIRLRQILNNLINNAIKFTSEGRVTLSLSRAQNELGANYVRFEISDTGIGIAAEVQSQLFRPFTQVNESTTRRFGGTGLGLSISRKFVEYMDGTIGLESVEGQGSTFWFELPATDRVPDATDSHAPSAPQMGESRAAYPNLRVLIVDDNVANQLIASELCRQRHGIYADSAEDGRQALELVSRNQYDLIFMDCMMPEMDGYQATRALRSGEGGELAKNITIIALTANASSEGRDACLDCGMNDYLTKPIKPDALAAMLSKWAHRGEEPPIAELQSKSPIASQLDAVDLPLFEPQRLNLMFDGDSALIGNLLDAYLESLEEVSALLKNAIEDIDKPDTIRNLSHRMKGSASEYGVERLARYAAHIEDCCVAGNLEEVVKSAPETFTVVVQSSQAIHRYQQSLA